jgi:hypothetical protein
VNDLLPSEIPPRRIPHDTWDQPLFVRRRVKHLELGPTAHKEAPQSMLDAELGDIAAGDRLELLRRQLDRCTRDGCLAVRSDLKEHELIAATRRNRTHPMRFTEVYQHGTCRGDVLHKRYRGKGIREPLGNGAAG